MSLIRFFLHRELGNFIKIDIKGLSFWKKFLNSQFVLNGLISNFLNYYVLIKLTHYGT